MVTPLQIIIIIFSLIVILILYQIFRWYQLYLKAQRLHTSDSEKKVLKKPVPKYQLQYGSSYLLLESKSTQGYKLFSSYISLGNKGLLITRVFPARIRKQYNLGNTRVVWLSRTQAKKAVNPTNLGVLLEEVREFITNKQKTLVLLDGLEYLIIENDFERVLKFINSLEDEIALNNSRLLVSVNPKILDTEKKALLEKTMRILYGGGEEPVKKAVRRK